ncbi:MAG: twin-arginine translocase subunit TatC, partial [Gemmatimonadales bacterium]
ALKVLFSFQSEALALVITYNEYFSFVLQIVLALGLSFELPLVIILLSALGVLTPAGINRFRRFAIVLACVAGALLSPGADAISMIMMTLPLLLLYEVGFLGAVVVHRRRLRRDAATAALVLLLALGARPAGAQEPVPAPPVAQRPTPGLSADSLGDTTRARPGQPVDTATARRLGLPTAPAHSFAPADSLVDALMVLPGYEVTRYRADSATLLADQRKILLDGEAMTQRRGTTLEADSITYQESSCVLRAAGSPHLFDGASVLVGQAIRYDTCLRRGVVEDALTNFQQGSTVWFLRGDLAQDSSAARLYAASSEITSCNLPVPHYHFRAREVKWISKNIMVARPAILYVRDVPILWLPFVFQDARPGRRSGILIPQFGLNDLVRPNTGYNRQVTNLGYYWAPSDYFDLTGRLDWFANRSVQYGISGQYRWLNRFVSGALTYKQDRQSAGTVGTTIQWDHRQSFNLSTSLNFDLNYVSSRSITLQNAIDPRSSTQLISSSANFTKRYRWGTVTLGGNRRQSLSDNSASQTLPALTISPKPFDLRRNVTWSPGLSFTNVQTLNTRQSAVLVARANGSVDTLRLTADSRITALNLDTPLRFGGFNWRNSLRVTDQQNGARSSLQFNAPDSSPGAQPGDSVSVTRTSNGSFSTGVDWDTGINLPTLFRGSWKLQPVLGIANATSGPFLLRNQNTNGSYVHQGKRFSLVLSASPTFFGFFPGFGPLSRIRHSLSPTISYTYNPAARVPEDFARALAGPGRPLSLRSDPTQT